MYMDLHRPSLHILRKLNAEGELNTEQSLFMAQTKPVEELYDYINDPHCVNNLAEDPQYADELDLMRGYMDDWLSKNTDNGLEDRTERKLSDSYKEENRLRYYLKKYQPEVWEAICDGIIFDEYDYYKRLMKQQKQSKK